MGELQFGGKTEIDDNNTSVKKLMLFSTFVAWTADVGVTRAPPTTTKLFKQYENISNFECTVKSDSSSSTETLKLNLR